MMPYAVGARTSRPGTMHRPAPLSCRAMGARGRSILTLASWPHSVCCMRSLPPSMRGLVTEAHTAFAPSPWREGKTAEGTEEAPLRVVTNKLSQTDDVASGPERLAGVYGRAERRGARHRPLT